MMDDAKYREILEGKLFQSPRDLRLGWRFTFLQDNNPKHTTKQHSSGLMGNIYMSWNGLVKAQTSIQLRICGMT
uniref:SJCHGC09765 protein n=1 Tax=Schistosoma japonicum TaxID=6182 RepID=Q5BQY0_SCHJA|nr:SJCHGC09765 protein [Schistosoma japonicum]